MEIKIESQTENAEKLPTERLRNEQYKEFKEKPSLMSEIWTLLPFFLLHMATGLAWGFTSVLLHEYQHHPILNGSNLHHDSCVQKNISWMGVALNGDTYQCSQVPGDSSTFLIVLATAEDYAPILLSILSGFLQQLVSPLAVLEVATLPAALSWLFVLANPRSQVLVIASRFMAGIANGLLLSNVYAAELSHRENRQALKMLEGASRSSGFILIYVLQLIFWDYSDNIRWIACTSMTIPLLSLALFLRQNCSTFSRHNGQEKSKNSLGDLVPKIHKVGHIKKNKWMKISKCGSPSVYRPLFLIAFIICLQHCSGLAFTKKFLLQLLQPKDPSSDPRLATIFAIAISTIRLFANLFMARLVKTFRVRILYFFSLFSTSFCLIILGVFLDDCLHVIEISADVTKYVTVLLLAIHVFVVQFGLQSLGGNLTDILFPKQYKPVMKGVMKAITAITLVFFLFLLTFNVNCVIKYSWTFWIMGTVLLLASPVVWVFIPEVRNIGNDMALEFYQNNTTTFFATIHRSAEYQDDNNENEFNLDNSAKSSQNRSSLETCLKIENTQENMNTNSNLLMYLTQITNKILYCVKRSKTLKESMKDQQHNTFNFKFDMEEKMTIDEVRKHRNNERVFFVRNIHPQAGHLQKKKNQDRILIGKGPVILKDSVVFKVGGIFLFNDIVIISKCVQSNMRYIGEHYFNHLDNTFKISREEASIKFEDSSKNISVTFVEIAVAKVWEEYVNYYKEKMCEEKIHD